MADEETGWSEKGKRSGRAKKPPKASRESVSETVNDKVDAARDAVEETASDAKAKASGTASSAEQFAAGADKRATPTRPSSRTSGSDSDSTVVRSPAGGDAGARKVARAAATAGQRDVSFASRLGFPALVGLVCLLGLAAVIYAWTTRDALAAPRQSIDHWHAVYGVYDCTQEGENKYLNQFLSGDDALGIHSHGDGIIHIHPFFEESSGENAQMRHFFNEMRVGMTPEKFTLDTGAELVAGTPCADGTGNAELRLLHWDFDFQALDGQGPTEVFTDDFGLVKFDNDREVYIFAFVGEDMANEDIPLPPDVRFEALNNVSAALEYEPDVLIPQDSGVDGETEVQVEVDGEEGDG